MNKSPIGPKNRDGQRALALRIGASEPKFHRVFQPESNEVNVLAALGQLWQYRDLLFAWVKREVKVRYKQSLLGAAWAVLQPLSIMIVFSIVFTFFVRVSSDSVPYPIFSYVALVPWTLLSSSISFGVPSIVNNMHLVTKIYFPREILPFAAVIVSLLDCAVASTVFLGMVFFYRVSLQVTALLVPLLLGIQIVLTLGVVLLASAINVHYRDIRFVVPLGIQLWMYATPIIYPVSLVPEHWRPLYMLNPMAGLIEGYRAVILRGAWPQWEYIGLSAFISIALFVGGYWSFKRLEAGFADII